MKSSTNRSDPESPGDGACPVRVSVVTPTLNVAKHLEQCLESVFSQTHANIENVVIDGGSTDGTIEIVRRHADRIAHWVSEPDCGIYDAMNKGLAAATGDVVYFLNADDYLVDDGVIADVAAAFAADPATDLAYGDVIVQGGDGDGTLRVGREITRRALVMGLMSPHQGIFTRRRVFDRVGSFNADYAISADFDFVVRCHEQGCTFARLQRPVAVFRLGGASTTYRNAMASRMEVLRTVRERFGWGASFVCGLSLGARGLPQIARPVLVRTGIVRAYWKWKARAQRHRS
jgi:glycosyltransferase involved in cell wall biosynthesis